VTETRYFPGGDQRLDILVDGAATDGALTLLRLYLPAGAAAGAHRHTRESETVVVREGELWVVLEGQRHELEPGDAIHLPQRSLHSFGSDGGAVVDIVAVPAGLEDFFRVVCSDDAAAPPPPADDVRAAAERAGLDFSGS
jgi:quercetin dioxygenase-like cupin family protein